MVVLAGGLVAALLASETSSKEKGTDDLLEQVAAHTTHGWVDDERSIPELKRRFDAGERLFVTCGTLSMLAQRLLAERGVDSRLVTTLTRRPFNGIDDGHTMLEVRTADGWDLYDLTDNRVAVDSRGAPVSFMQQMRSGPNRHWRVLSTDKWIDLRGVSPAVRRYTVERFIKAGLDSWYDRVLGVPLIETRPGSGHYAFHEGSQRARVEAYSPAYKWVDEASWKALSGE